MNELIHRAVDQRPRLHRNHVHVTGRLRSSPDDFVVEEIPAYEPAGDGEHLFVWIEKRERTGEWLRRYVAQTFGIRPVDVGMAGLKDRHAVTRQFISIPARCEANLYELECDGIRVLNATRHRNKLRTGHLKGNRFSILVRDCRLAHTVSQNAGDHDVDGRLDVATALKRAADDVMSLGLPNYFGNQRFGHDASTARTGFELLSNSQSFRSTKRRAAKFERRLALSAAQSVLFNNVLADRIHDRLMQSVVAGDVMQRLSSGGLFSVDDVSAEQLRFEQRETVMTGPMFGPKMFAPQSETAQREQRVLNAAKFPIDCFAAHGSLTRGTRRPLLVRPTDIDVTAEPDGVRLQFDLPAGSYATVLLEELGLQFICE